MYCSPALAGTPPGEASLAVVVAWRDRGGVRELLRYGGVGLFCSGLYSGLFLLLSSGGLAGSVRANLVASLVSTVVGSELHRRLTFRAEERVGWFDAQWRSAGLATVGLVVTSAVLAVLEGLVPGAPWWEQVLLVNAATALIGLGRYLAMSGWVFRGVAPALADRTDTTDPRTR